MAEPSAVEIDQALRSIFDPLGCSGSLCALEPATGREIAWNADRSEVAASVIKVLIALQAEIDMATGRLDPRRPMLLPAASRTPGPVGFSLYADDVTTSVRDLVVAALTISDNVAADALLEQTGLDRCNDLARTLGLNSTRVVSSLDEMINSIARDAGAEDWAALEAASAAATPQQLADLNEQVRRSSVLKP